MLAKKFIPLNDMATINTKTSYQPPAIQKAFQMLKAVSESPGMGVSELAEKIGLGKSSIHGLAKALLEAGALQQNSKKKYSLGTAILELSFRNWNYIKVCEKSQPLLEELRDLIGQTVFLGALSGGAGFIMTTAESHNPLKISSPVGASIPLLAGAVGKVFLARMEDHEVINILREHGLPRFTPKSIVNERKYMLELAKVRKERYALDDEEYLPGVKAVAVALDNQHGLPLAVWVVGFAGSMENDKTEVIIKETLRTADKLRILLDSSL